MRSSIPCGSANSATGTAYRHRRPRIVTGRVRHIWRTSTPSQSRGWYLAGLGADAGASLAAISGHIIELMNHAEVDMATDDHAAACDRLVESLLRSSDWTLSRLKLRLMTGLVCFGIGSKA